MEIKTFQNLHGGNGSVIIKHIVGPEVLKDKCGLFAEVILAPGCSIGYHEHHGESETYYILSGKATYDDNGSVRDVYEGEVTFTPDGSGHGIANNTDRKLHFMALIVKE